MTAGLWLLLWVACLLAGGLLSALNQSLRDVSRGAMDELLEKRGDDIVKGRVRRIMEDFEGHAQAIALPRVFCNLVVAIGMVMYLTALRQLPAPTWIELTVGVVITSVLLWIASAIIPAAVARHAAEMTVAAWSLLIRLCYYVARPLLSLATLTNWVVRRMTGRKDLTEQQEAHEEILNVVEEARQIGQLDDFEQRMMEAVVSFRDRTVTQIMTPRTDIEAIELTSNLGEVVAFVRKCGKSRVPVYAGDLDHIMGIFYVKDLMRWLAGERGGQGFSLKSVIRPAVFVPRSKTVRELLNELLAKRVHIAIVADEFGGTAGLVTLEDMFEEVFGDIQDEYEKPEDETPDVRVIPVEKAAELDARTYVGDANARMETVGIEIPESEDYDTVGGFVTVTAGRIPEAGESFRYNGMRVTVLESEPTRVTRIKLEAVQEEPEEPEAARKGAPAGGK